MCTEEKHKLELWRTYEENNECPNWIDEIIGNNIRFIKRETASAQNWTQRLFPKGQSLWTHLTMLMAEGNVMLMLLKGVHVQQQEHVSSWAQSLFMFHTDCEIPRNFFGNLLYFLHFILKCWSEKNQFGNYELANLRFLPIRKHHDKWGKPYLLNTTGWFALLVLLYIDVVRF